MKKFSQDKNDLIIRHEFFHLLDDRFNIFWETRDDTSRIKKQIIDFFRKLQLHHNSLKNYEGPSFLANLSESKFIPRVGFGGHAYDNEREFFASLVNSLFVKNEDKVLSSKSLVFLESYKESLELLAKRLEEIKEFKKSPLLVAVKFGNPFWILF